MDSSSSTMSPIFAFLGAAMVISLIRRRGLHNFTLA
jgi:hypothetical protein